MTKITVHPDALEAATAACLKPGGGIKETIEAAVQWYIDHPQITPQQCFDMRWKAGGTSGQQAEFIRELLTLALSGEPKVPQEVKGRFPNWESMNQDRLNEIIAAYNLGKGAK